MKNDDYSAAFSAEEFRHVTLDKIRTRLQDTYDARKFRTLSLEAFLDVASDRIAVRMERWFAGVHMPEHTFVRTVRMKAPKFSYPATWWDHVKHDFADRWWMRWIVRRWPIKYTTIEQEMTGEARVHASFDVLYPDFVPPEGFEREPKIILPINRNY